MHSNLENQNIYLAPMEDVTDYPFRQVLLKTGRPDVFFTEFVNIEGLTSKEGKESVSHRLQFSEEEKPIIVQLWGRDPKKFREAYEIIREYDFDGVNINMGCPVKKVVKAGCGSALIAEYTLVEEIIKEMEGIDMPLSIKTRMGQSGFDKEWIKFLLNFNLHTLFIHFRNAKQVFSGFADWKMIEEIIGMRDKCNPNIRIVGNGDITSLEQAYDVQKKYEVDGVMIGRALLRNPWVFSNYDPSKEERISTLLFHLKLMRDFSKNHPKKGWSSIKKFYYAYLREDEELTKLRKKLFQTNDIDESITLLEG